MAKSNLVAVLVREIRNKLCLPKVILSKEITFMKDKNGRVEQAIRNIDSIRDMLSVIEAESKEEK